MSPIVLHVVPGEPLAATVDAHEIELRPKERAVAAALAIFHPDEVSLGQLINLVWPGDAPATAKQSIHNHLARLRASAPGLVKSSVAGYVLGDDVSIAVTGRADANDAFGEAIDTDYLIEFADVPEVRRARVDFIRRHVEAQRADSIAIIRAGDVSELLEPLEAAVLREPGDERSWWLLAVATTKVAGVAAGTAVVDRSRSALGDVGLGLGRRLLDLDGMLRDGVDDVHVLLRDPFGSSGSGAIRPLAHGISESLAEARSTWAEHERFLICVRGHDDALRRSVLARLIDDVRASGFGTAFARHLPGDIGPPTLRSALRGARPVVMVIDGFDHCDDPATLAHRVIDRLPSDVTGWIVAESPGGGVDAALRLAGLVGETPTHVIDMSARDARSARRDDGSSVERASGDTLQLVRVLAAIGEPVVPEHLSSILPKAAAAALDAARAGLARVDAATHTIDLASNAVAAAALAKLDETERRALAIDLMTLELPALDRARRRELRSRWSLEAYGPTDDRTIAHTLEAAEAYSDRGEYDVAASVIRRTLEPIEAAEGPSANWCRLAIRAGQAMLAGGDASGDDVLAEVVDAASTLGDDALAAHATHEWCRLGVAGGAGSADEDRRQVTTDLLARLNDPGDRAMVGAAAAMVLSLAGEPDRLRRLFVDAVADASASDDATVMAEVLALAYMSIPMHSDITDRLGHTDTLLQLAERHHRPESRWEALQLRYSTEVMAGDPAFRRTLIELDEVASQLHERSRDWEMHFIRSSLAILDGDLDRARREIDDSLAFGGQVNDDRVAAVFGAHHFVASMIEGTTADLLEPLRSLTADQPGIGAWNAACAVAAAAAGERDEAVAALAAVIGNDGANLVHDPVYSAGLIAVGEAAAATRERAALEVADALLEPLAGMWSWCGSCTFGPIDLTRARVAQALGQHARAEQLAANAVVTCAEMHAPVFAQQATDLLLAIATA